MFKLGSVLLLYLFVGVVFSFLLCLSWFCVFRDQCCQSLDCPFMFAPSGFFSNVCWLLVMNKKRWRKQNSRKLFTAQSWPNNKQKLKWTCRPGRGSKEDEIYVKCLRMSDMYTCIWYYSYHSILAPEHYQYESKVNRLQI